MKETVLLSLRDTPAPEFGARLRARLRELDAQEPPATRRRWPVLRVAASLSALGMAGALLSVPAVRAAAESFLARFRMVHFVAIDVDEARVAQLRSREIDLPRLVGERVQVLQDPGPPRGAASLEEAGAAAGIRVRVPAWLPPEVTLRGTSYRGAGRVQVVAENARLQHVLDFLGLDDVEVPPALDGQAVSLDVPAMVRLTYANARGAEAHFLQSRAPEVALPQGVDMAVLAEIALRVFGFGAEEARRFAQAVDWRSTMLVPIPSDGARWKRVDVNGNPGLLIARAAPPPASSPSAPSAKEVHLLIWSADGMVFALQGNFRDESLLRMAYSAR